MTKKSKKERDLEPEEEDLKPVVDYVVLDKQDLSIEERRLILLEIEKDIYETVVRILSKRIIQMHSKESVTEEDINLFLEMVMDELKRKGFKTLKEAEEVIDRNLRIIQTKKIIQEELNL